MTHAVLDLLGAAHMRRESIRENLRNRGNALKSLIALTLLLATTPVLAGQYLYVLKLVPRLHDDSAWTEADNAAIGRHFRHLQQAAAEGTVILGGRTQEPGAETMGLVIFEAEDDAAARAFMNADPAIVEGLMTATLHPYQVAMQRAAPCGQR